VSSTCADGADTVTAAGSAGAVCGIDVAVSASTSLCTGSIAASADFAASVSRSKSFMLPRPNCFLAMIVFFVFGLVIH
jgi:hypothetical protein